LERLSKSYKILKKVEMGFMEELTFVIPPNENVIKAQFRPTKENEWKRP